MLVWVLKPKNLNLPACFISAAQVLMAGVISSMPVMAWMKNRSTWSVCSLFRLLFKRSVKLPSWGTSLVTRKISLRASGLRAKKRPMPSSLRPLP